MTTDPDHMPTWGVLVEAPEDRVRTLLAGLREGFDLRQLLYRTSGSWTAVFNMEPGPNGDDSAAKLLKDHGFAPVYHFDFNRYEFITSKWDGASWVDDDYGPRILHSVGIKTPGFPEPRSPDPAVAVASRWACVLEGLTAADARLIVPDLRVEDGPRGAIVYEPEVAQRADLWHTGRDLVFELLYYPHNGALRVRIMRGDDCLGTFRPGATSTWDGTPFLADVEGEVEPERIVALLGVDPAFIAPLEEPHLESPTSPSTR